MNTSLKAMLLSAALAVAPPAAHAFGWDDIEDGAESVGRGFEEGWETIEDAVIPETEEERREEARERAEDAREEAAEEAAKQRGEQPIINH